LKCRVAHQTDALAKPLLASGGLVNLPDSTATVVASAGRRVKGLASTRRFDLQQRRQTRIVAQNLLRFARSIPRAAMNIGRSFTQVISATDGQTGLNTARLKLYRLRRFEVFLNRRETPRLPVPLAASINHDHWNRPRPARRPQFA